MTSAAIDKLILLVCVVVTIGVLTSVVRVVWFVCDDSAWRPAGTAPGGPLTRRAGQLGALALALSIGVAGWMAPVLLEPAATALGVLAGLVVTELADSTFGLRELEAETPAHPEERVGGLP